MTSSEPVQDGTGDALFDLTTPATSEHTGAVLSDDMRYRYRLWRRWAPGPSLLFVMLNPSTADATKNDPTITRCVGFAKREGCGRLDVVNLFGFRSSKPVDLRTASDPVGPDNNRHILDAAVDADKVIVAWGNSVPKAYRNRPAEVAAMLAPIPLRCLGENLDGSPWHPLFIPADCPFRPWSS